MNIKVKPGLLITNLLLAIAITFALIYGVLKWLDSYTLHNQGVTVPDIKGLPVSEAARFLTDRGLRYNVIDSVYSRNAKPGAVVEVSPTTGLKVKAGRIVYITVNAQGPQKAAVPAVKDLSFRQAYALLKAKGFEEIDVVYIAGAHKDLVISVELRGRALEEGERVQLTAPLSLIVSNGSAGAFGNGDEY
ncbi:MAG: PASTA domain-containing protein [Tannerellaceae bacterium]|jgi:beta-lactam-binding protein with PASTA domain|nr:PASTA domain-containing protein [Tannerellaceae bacterium]